MASIDPNNVLVRCNSHRAHDRMCDALGRQPTEYYVDLTLNNRNHYWEVTPQEFDKIKGIKGITNAKRLDRSILRETIKW